MSVEDSYKKAAAFWDRESTAPTHVSWMENPAVREYINGAFGDAWPLDWFEAEFPGLRFDRALSIGCGTGGLERDLIRRDLCGRIFALDGSIQSLAIARHEAEAVGMGSRISYFASDFNEPIFTPPPNFDAVFFHQSMHHVGKLEKLLGACLRALKPGGTLYLDELIGPSRSEWSDDVIADARRAFDTVPLEARTCAVLPYPIQIDDPSEALRSGEILEQVEIGFESIAFRGYGGNILAVLYPAVRWPDVDPSLIHELIEADRRVASAKGPYHAVIVAKPKRGVSRFCATARYFLEPKWRRARLEVLRRLGKSARF